MNKNTLYRLVFISSFVTILTGCTNVEPYERSFLAKDHMQLEPNPLHATLMEHAYFSREGISGGYGLSGGGCGCN